MDSSFAPSAVRVRAMRASGQRSSPRSLTTEISFLSQVMIRSPAPVSRRMSSRWPGVICARPQVRLLPGSSGPSVPEEATEAIRATADRAITSVRMTGLLCETLPGTPGPRCAGYAGLDIRRGPGVGTRLGLAFDHDDRDVVCRLARAA